MSQPIIQAISHVLDPYKNPMQSPDGGKFAVGVPLAAVPKNRRLVDLKPFFESWRLKPETRKGTVRLHNLADFITFINRYKNDGESIIFYKGRYLKTYTCVFDYHPPGADLTITGAGAFRAIFKSFGDFAGDLKAHTNLTVLEGITPTGA